MGRLLSSRAAGGWVVRTYSVEYSSPAVPGKTLMEWIDEISLEKAIGRFQRLNPTARVISAVRLERE